PDACQLLTFMAGRSLTALAPEIEKLAAYLGDRRQIERADVEAMVTPAPEYTAFQMIDAALEKDVGRAQTLLKALLEAGETPVGVLALIERQMRMMTHIRRLRARGESVPAIAAALSLNGYAAQMAARHAARFSEESLEQGYRASVDADYAIKSGRLRDEAALGWVLMVLNGL
ncbi:MAG: DNA polymerase III subunit delta, partial [Clostridiales bacterium]|nr:DNA polymerase III subunit delta [Clostridiales bacterium]